MFLRLQIKRMILCVRVSSVLFIEYHPTRGFLFEVEMYIRYKPLQYDVSTKGHMSWFMAILSLSNKWMGPPGIRHCYCATTSRPATLVGVEPSATVQLLMVTMTLLNNSTLLPALTPTVDEVLVLTYTSLTSLSVRV